MGKVGFIDATGQKHIAVSDPTISSDVGNQITKDSQGKLKVPNNIVTIEEAEAGASTDGKVASASDVVELSSNLNNVEEYVLVADRATLFKVGKVVHLHAHYFDGNAIIPEGFRPSSKYGHALFYIVWDYNNDRVAVCSVSRDGIIKYSGLNDVQYTSVNAYYDISWITD